MTTTPGVLSSTAPDVSAASPATAKTLAPGRRSPTTPQECFGSSGHDGTVPSSPSWRNGVRLPSSVGRSENPCFSLRTSGPRIGSSLTSGSVSARLGDILQRQRPLAGDKHERPAAVGNVAFEAAAVRGRELLGQHVAEDDAIEVAQRVLAVVARPGQSRLRQARLVAVGVGHQPESRRREQHPVQLHDGVALHAAARY